MSAFASGIITFATAAGSMSMKVTARPILRRFGFRNVILVNGIISAATIAMCAFFTGATPAPLIFVLLLIAGFFQSLQFTATQAIAYADVSNPQMSTATSIASMAQQLSRGFGIAFVAVLLHLSLAWRGASTLGTSTSWSPSRAPRRWRCCCLAFGLPSPPMRPPRSAATGRNRRRRKASASGPHLLLAALLMASDHTPASARRRPSPTCSSCRW